VRILLDNAVRHGPSDSPIVLTVDRREDVASIAVHDRGTPIAAAERARIFERFERGSAMNEAPGFGLGLAIGRELAGRMNGRLELEDGDGTRFRLSLPAARPG